MKKKSTKSSFPDKSSTPRRIGFARDWFGRKAENDFTEMDYKSKLFDWDSGRSNYSSFFVRSNKESLEVSSKMINSMFRVLGVDKKLKHVVHSPEKAEEIQIPMALLKDPETGKFKDQDNANLDAFYGGAIQNAALATLQTKPEYIKTLKALNTKRKDFGVDSLLYSVINTERINKKLGRITPGYLRFVQKYKNYMFKEKYKPSNSSEDDYKRFLELLVKMLRYPTEVDQEELNEFKVPLEHVKENILSKTNGIPETSQDCEILSKDIKNYIYQYFEIPPEDEQNGDGEGDGNGEDEDEDNENNSSGNSFSDFAKRLSEQMFKSSESTEAEKKALNQMQEEGDKPNEKFEYNVADEFKETDGVYYRKSISDANSAIKYKQSLKNINTVKAAVLRKLFERKSKDYRLVLKGMRSGILDTCKLAEAVQGVPTIHERYAHVKTNKICVGVLIDESGSMSGSSKIEKAQQAAIFINEVFKNSRDVELFIYGHTADHHTKAGYQEVVVDIYREPGNESQIFSLGNVYAKSNNKDGSAILSVAQRMRKKTPNNGILVVISDGAPSACSYGSTSAIKHTKECVQKAEKLGFNVIQIAIEAHVRSSEMFTHYVKMTDIRTLPGDLTSYLSSKLDRMIKTQINY